MDTLKLWELQPCFSFFWYRMHFLYDYTEVGFFALFCFALFHAIYGILFPALLNKLCFRFDLSRQVNKPAWQPQRKAIRKLRAEITKQNLRPSSEMSIPSQFTAISGQSYAAGTKADEMAYCVLPAEPKCKERSRARCCLWELPQMWCVTAGDADRCEPAAQRSALLQGSETEKRSLGRRSLHFHIWKFFSSVPSLLHKTENKQEAGVSTLIKPAIFTRQYKKEKKKRNKPLWIDKKKKWN